MTRPLTQIEHDELADMVPDPADWWDNAQAVLADRAEAALAAKRDRGRAAYAQRLAAGTYRTRAERDADAAAAEASRPRPTRAQLIQRELDGSPALAALVAALVAKGVIDRADLA